MGDFDALKDEIDALKRSVEKIQATQSMYVNEHHKLEKQIVEMRTDLHYIIKNQESLSSNINKMLFIIGGGFIAAIVSFIVGGGLMNK
jgi:predicted  nucleic acid-binding Zn-ribbon protein